MVQEGSTQDFCQAQATSGENKFHAFKSPQTERLGFNLVKERPISLGYSQENLEFECDPSFLVRGLWFDPQYGGLFAVDAHGNILVCVHGCEFLKHLHVHETYRNNFQPLDETRVHVLITLLSLPETKFN
jgi:5'-nucleotidase